MSVVYCWFVNVRFSGDPQPLGSRRLRNTHTHTHTNTHARIYENDTHIKMCPDTEFLQTFLVIDSICSKCQLIAVWMECWMNGLWNEFRNKLKTDGAKAKVHGQCGVCVCVDDYSNWSMAAIYSGQCRCRSARRTFDFNFSWRKYIYFPAKRMREIF